MAVNKVTYLEHLKQLGLRESLLIGQVAQTAADAIEEQAGQIGALSDRLDDLSGVSGEVSRTVDVTLTVAGWGDNVQYVVPVEGLMANQNGVVGLSQGISQAEREAAANADMYVSGQADGSFTITRGGDKPTRDIPIPLILFE